MCGIAGFFGFRNDNLIKKISKELAHRGPNGEGIYIDDNVTLLNRRLAIIDIEGGKQPIFNENKNLVVVYNGEIYNYLELKKILEEKNHQFKTKSDTEVILHAYEEWQEKAFNRFNGMFAIALYDKKEEKLILARDHFGIKPLYYSFIDNKRNNNNQIIFSSEIKPIFYSGLVKKQPNDWIIYRYLKYRVHDDNKETFFKEIYRLMPGEILTIDKNKIEIKKYTNLEKELEKFIINCNSLKDFDINMFRKKIIEAVRLRLVSDVSVGTCLSGGIDSSTIVVLINQLLKEKVKEAVSIGKIQKTFSAVFPSYTNNEEKYIDYLIKNKNIKNYKIYPQADEFIKEIKDFIKTQEEPTISTGPYAQYKLMQLAKKHVTVVLDGQGADEIFAGYLPYFFVYFKQLFKEKKYFQLLKELWFGRALFFFLIKGFLNKINLKKNNQLEKIFNNQFLKKYENEKFNIVDDNLKNRLLKDIFYDSLPALLRYEDKNSMHFSIEGRLPFLDYNLLLFVFSLPTEAIIKNGFNKFIIRKALKEILPKEIINRRDKIGFTTPEYDWFFQLKDEILKIFSSESFSKNKYFNQKEVILAFLEFLNKKNNDTLIFWRIINLELWQQYFFPKKKENIDQLEEMKLTPNKGKTLTIEIDKKKYFRYPIKTRIIKKNDNLLKIIYNLFNKIPQDKFFRNKKFFLVISEKIIAVSQGHSFYLWQIKPSLMAKILSFFVTKTPYGIGLGSPWTMQLAIKEAGILKILLAATIALITRPLAIKGLFYKIAGEEISTIDGPTEYSIYPSNICAKLPPKNPQKFCQTIYQHIFQKFPRKDDFLGVVVIDANDLGQKVLANTTNLKNQLIEKIFQDNPMGQADEQTPMTLVVFDK